MKDTKIEWAHHTFNPWWGCEKVSPGCAHCYAEAFAKRTGHGVWGSASPRRFFGEKHWAEPLKWDRAALHADERPRVFCASMADVFEDRPDLVEQRRRLFETILRTQSLDWLLLTKRPENIARLWPRALGPYGESMVDLVELGAHNVWLGTTVENQEQADLRIPLLLQIPAAVRFLSVEPLLGSVMLPLTALTGHDGSECPRSDPGCEGGDEDCHDACESQPRIHWVIVGGESGPGARPMHPAWAVSVLEQCRAAGVPAFFKQTGSHLARLHGYQDAKGGDLSELPPAWRVREVPSCR